MNYLGILLLSLWCGLIASTKVEEWIEVPEVCVLVETKPSTSEYKLESIDLAFDMLDRRFFKRSKSSQVTRLSTAKNDLVDPENLTSCLVHIDLSQTTFKTPTSVHEESFTLSIDSSEDASSLKIIIEPYSLRSLFYAIGKLIRTAKFTSPIGVLLPKHLTIKSVPEYHVRGEQISYRAASNTWDAWNTTQMQNYYEEFILFGANLVEFTAPDNGYSPLFQLPPQEMMERCSSIAEKFDLNFSIWFPLGNENFGTAWKNLTRLNSLFVPAGDPGDTPPRQLFQILDPIIRNNLLLEFPNSEVWVSNQMWNATENAEFYNIIKSEYPEWLTGIVYGPHSRDSLAEMRQKLPKNVPIRNYPDACHMIISEFPQPNWTATFALTEQREFVNPLPQQTFSIGKLQFPNTIGTVVYSDGVTADYNMFMWAAMSWDLSGFNIEQFTREYVHTFLEVPLELEINVISAYLNLVRDWIGDVSENIWVSRNLNTLNEVVERVSGDRYNKMWRLQSLVYRVNYDAYVKTRWIREKDAEKRALEILSNASQIGSLAAIANATTVLLSANDPKIRNSDPNRITCFTTADLLFKSVGMQLSVPLYHASSLGRGDSLDTIDNNLNNIAYLLGEFHRIKNFTEKERLDAISDLVFWKNPSRQSEFFYDNLGDINEQPHLIFGPGFSSDPSFYFSSFNGFTDTLNQSTAPIQPFNWFFWAESLFDNSLKMYYENLDEISSYTVRYVFGNGRNYFPVRLLANNFVVHDYIEKPVPPKPLEFILPANVTKNGTLLLSWNSLPGGGEDGMSCEISEVWVYKTVQKQ